MFTASLYGVVLRQISNDKVGIEPNHRDLAACLVIAAFISMDTGFLRLSWNIPSSSRIDRVPGTMANLPLSISTNSIRSPASNPSASRTRTGIVIWPFEVIVADAIVLRPFPYLRRDSLLGCKEVEASGQDPKDMWGPWPSYVAPHHSQPTSFLPPPSAPPPPRSPMPAPCCDRPARWLSRNPTASHREYSRTFGDSGR